MVWVLLTLNQKRFPGEVLEPGLGLHGLMSFMDPREEGFGCPK